MAVILDAQNICKNLEAQIREDLKSLSKVCLASVAVGKDYSACIYRSAQRRIAGELGIEYLSIDLKEDVCFKEFAAAIKGLNQDKKITGIILNKPFPVGFKDEDVFSLLDEKKDVEGMHPANLGKFFMGENRIVSPTVLSIMKLLEASEVDLRGKRVTIVGFSSIIGKPLSLLLGNEFATVSITHIETYNKGDLPFYVKNADILISAAGVPQLIKGEWIKEGAVVIDVGTAESAGKVTGDVEFAEAKKQAAFITPVPGGVGRLTAMCLFDNLVFLAKRL